MMVMVVAFAYATINAAKKIVRIINSSDHRMRLLPLKLMSG